MASDREIRTNQKTLLFELLRVKKEMVSKDIMVEAFEELLKKTETGMDAEDIAWVREKVAEREGNHGFR